MNVSDLLSTFIHLETSVRIRLYCAALQSQWFRPPAEIYALAKVSHRRAEIELARLVDEGWLERHEKGSANYTRLVRFVPAGSPPTPIKLIGVQRSKRSGYSDQVDRGTAIETIGVQRSDGSGSSTSTHARGPAPPDPDLKTCYRPSVLEGSGEGHARTGGTFRDSDLRGSDVKWVAAQWSTSGHVAHTCWTRLLGFGLTRVEGREYLEAARRGSHAAFNGLELAKRPLGAACTCERVEPWIMWYRRGRADERPATPEPRKVVERDDCALDEAEAMAELVRRDLARGGRSRA